MATRKLAPFTPEELVSALKLLQGVVPFPENLQVLAERRLKAEREEKFLQVQARLERNAKRKAWGENPRRVAAQVKRREARHKYLAQKRFETEQRKRDALAKHAAELTKNPTLAWRHPRRAGWKPSDDYARGSRRKNRKQAAAQGNSTSAPAPADRTPQPSSTAQDDSAPGNATPDPRS